MSAPARFDAVGARRRLRALARDAFSSLCLQDHTGVHESTLRELTTGVRLSVTEPTFRRIYRVYRDFDGLTGPRPRARNKAVVLGWPGREHWTPDSIDLPGPDPVVVAVDLWRPASEVDDVIVERVCDEGQRLWLTRAERDVAIRRLNRQGLNDLMIADRIGMSDRRVLSRRRAMGLPPGVLRRPRGEGCKARAAS